jgi:hypothetical protein
MVSANFHRLTGTLPCKIDLRSAKIPVQVTYVFLPGTVHFPVPLFDFIVQQRFSRTRTLQDSHHQPKLHQLLHVIKLVNVRMQPQLFFGRQAGDHCTELAAQLLQLRGSKRPPALNVVYVY